MHAAQFRASPSGKLVSTIRGALAFVPNPLPPRIPLESVIDSIATASHHLGELAGISYGLENPQLLMAPFRRHEAVASSRIEGAVASMADVLSDEAGGRPERRPPDTREVRNYVRALEHAIARMPSLPLSLRLIREVHAALFAETDTATKAPFPAGDFRRVQNWIGGATPATARYVPPPAGEMAKALHAFEAYLHAKTRLPAVVDAALVHYQFEAIHPFPDGNGRVGRILIPLYLMTRNALPSPLLYLSSYFEQNRREYYDRLLEVSRRGDWVGWIDFFLRGVTEQASDTIGRVRRLAGLRTRLRSQALSVRSSTTTLRLIDLVFASPYVSMPSIRSGLGITHRAAQQQIDRLVGRGILAPIEGESRPRLYVAREILDIVQGHDSATGDFKPAGGSARRRT